MKDKAIEVFIYLMSFLLGLYIGHLLTEEENIKDSSLCEAYAEADKVTKEYREGVIYYHFSNISITQDDLFKNCIG